MKYLVMECHEAFAVLLDTEGRFVKACNKNYEVGQYVTEPVLIQDDSDLLENVYRIDRKRKAVKISFAAAVFAIFLCLNFFSLFVNDYMSIYIRINPEIRIDINRLGFVTDITGLNEDGAALLEKCDTSEKDEITLCESIIAEAFRCGYLENGGKVSVYVDSPDDKHFLETGTRLTATLEELNKGEFAADIEILSFSQYTFDSSLPEESSTAELITQAPETEASSPVQEPSTLRQHGNHKNNECND